MSMTRLTCLPVRVVCFGISGTGALSGDTACCALADIAVSAAAARPASRTDCVLIGVLLSRDETRKTGSAAQMPRHERDPALAPERVLVGKDFLLDAILGVEDLI